MDETETSWFGWIADNAKYVFWGVWGAGVGAFGSVFLGAVDIGGDALRVYLAVITAMVGASIALAANRGLDERKDRRESARKRYVVLALVNDLRVELQELDQQIEKALAIRNRVIVRDGTNLLPGEVGALMASAQRVHMRSEDMPSFDDIIESNEDAQVIVQCRSTFLYCHSTYIVDPEEPEERSRKKCATWALVHRPNRLIQRLQNIEAHMRKRIG